MTKTIPQLLCRLAVLALVLAVPALLCRPAYAEEAGGVSAQIPLVVQAAEGSSAAEAVSYFSITAQDNAPMPLQSTLCIRGAGTGSFGPIGYTMPGDYLYTVRQTSAAAVFRRDPTVYTVTVRIVNNALGALSAEVWAVRDDDTAGKTAHLVFTAAPLSAATATPAPTAPAKAENPATRAGVAIRHAPQTGDPSAPLLVLLCCIGSAAALVVLYRRRTK